MKTLTHKLLTLALLWGMAALDLNADPSQDVKQNLSSTDPSTRASAMQHFVDSLATANGQNHLTEAIPVLANGLSDSDVNVRRNAASGLLLVAAQTVRANNPTSGGPDLTADPSVRDALIKATSDPDAQVRQTALQTYALTYKLTPDVEDKIIAEFNAQEPATSGQPSNKPALLESLMIGGSPSPHATQFLTNLLDDPKYGTHVAERMAADKCPLSGAALDKLASKLTQEKDPVKRAAYARAIGTYGKQAQRYTPQLEAALANEKDDVTKTNIRTAIAKTNQ